MDILSSPIQGLSRAGASCDLGRRRTFRGRSSSIRRIRCRSAMPWSRFGIPKTTKKPISKSRKTSDEMTQDTIG
jgi:hypothetical protein